MSQDLLRAFETALKSATVSPKDGAAVALARRYARLMDEAAPAAKYRKPLLMLARVVAHAQETLRMTPSDERALEDMAVTISVALGEHSVASDLGPKFLAALEKLNMTMAGRVPGGKPEVPGDGGSTPLQLARQEAARLKIVRSDGA
jgi:hypothetical protein